ncbi:MAG: hypothetical protein WEB58_13555, partial [Planctomycetaceae bacterium]
GHDWCSVRISKEIVEFASGKDEKYAWKKAKVTQALSPEQQTILEHRGVLDPEEIHRLAGKTRKAMGADENKASCHSDFTPDEAAQKLQQEREIPLVPLDVLASTPEK